MKPFAFSELLVRIQNLPRRPTGASREALVVADLTLYLDQRRVFRAGARLDLSPQEYTLIELLAQNAGKVVTRIRIAEEVWGLAFDRDPNLVDAAIKRLRQKVDAPFEPALIQTQRGIGYSLPGRCRRQEQGLLRRRCILPQ